MSIAYPTGQQGDGVANSGSLTPTSAKSSTTLTDNKKKHGFFDNFKFGSRNHAGNVTGNTTDNLTDNATEHTPLPPETPKKAAKLLGLNAQGAAIPTTPQSQGDGAYDEPKDGYRVQHARPAPPNPMLTPTKSGTGSKFREEGLQNEATKPKASLWNKGKMTLASLSPHRPAGTRDHGFGLDVEDFATDRPDIAAASWNVLEANHVNSASNLHELQQKPLPTTHRRRPLPQARSQPTTPRRTRKKDGRPLDPMAPIQESSMDDIKTAYHHGAANTNWSTSQQAMINTSAGPSAPSAYTAGRGPAERYELAAEDLSPMDDDDKGASDDQDYPTHTESYDDRYQSDRGPAAAIWLRSPLQRVENRLLDVTESALERNKDTSTTNEYGRIESIIDTYNEDDLEEEEEDHGVHPGVPVDLSKMRSQDSDTMHFHQPERAGEDRFLSPMEAELEAIKASLDKSDAIRAETDATVAALKVSHEKDKLDFEKMKASQLTPIPPHLIPAGLTCDGCGHDVKSSDDNAGLVPLRRSIDLSEEPTVHTARAMTVTRFPPGSARLITIPPRRKSAGGPQGGEIPPPPPAK